jgi:hypothetical protein
MKPRLPGALTLCMVLCLATGCSGLLPKSREVTSSPWQTYREAQQTFDRIVPGKTTAAELKALDLDPDTMPNLAILNYSDVMRRFMANQSVTMADLDAGVQQCVAAKTECRGLEIHQKMVKRHRNGSFWLDFLGFKRETHTEGFRFNALVLLKDDVVIYKLTGGQPVIREQEHQQNPLGPVQTIGDKLLGSFTVTY